MPPGRSLLRHPARTAETPPACAAAAAARRAHRRGAAELGCGEDEARRCGERGWCAEPSDDWHPACSPSSSTRVRGMASTSTSGEVVEASARPLRGGRTHDRKLVSGSIGSTRERKDPRRGSGGTSAPSRRGRRRSGTSARCSSSSDGGVDRGDLVSDEKTIERARKTARGKGPEHAGRRVRAGGDRARPAGQARRRLDAPGHRIGLSRRRAGVKLPLPRRRGARAHAARRAGPRAERRAKPRSRKRARPRETVPPGFHRTGPCGCRDHARIDGAHLGRADRQDLAPLQHAQQFDLHAGRGSPTSSRKMVPPSAASNRPRLSAMAPVKAPLRYPNSSLSSNVSVKAPQFTAMNGLSLRALWKWYGARNDLFPATRLALQQHADGEVRHSPPAETTFSIADWCRRYPQNRCRAVAHAPATPPRPAAALGQFQRSYNRAFSMATAMPPERASRNVRSAS